MTDGDRDSVLNLCEGCHAYPCQCDEMQPEPCPTCGGAGQMQVTRDMAIDAGDRSMEGYLTACPTCEGSGTLGY